MATLFPFVACKWRADGRDFDVASHYSGSTESEAIAQAEDQEGKTWDKLTNEGWFISKASLLVRPVIPPPIEPAPAEPNRQQPRGRKKKYARK